MIYTSIFFMNSILYFVTCENYLPIFESLPPPLVYYAENSEESSKVLTCMAWPPAPQTEIKLYSTMRLANSDNNNPIQSQFIKPAPLHPLDSKYVQGSSVIVRSVIEARALSKLDLHCLAKTEFGAVISRPFRVVEARIGQFPSATNVGEAHKVVKYFMHGNVAYVDCDPPVSFPPALIEFRLNDTTIHMSRRYKYIKRPNSQRMTLLILAFEPRDQGYYRCIATNTVTGTTKTDPLVQQLKIRSPVTNVPVSIRMTISGKELTEQGPSSSGAADIISVREGMNVTLFCVMEGAPPPSVTTYKLRSNPNNYHRYVSDKEFGLLSISKVSVDDEDTCMCTETVVSDTVILKVQRRLSITQGPQDIRVTELGTQARFTCLSNDANITPQWYFNGRIRTQSPPSGRDSSLHIAIVRKEDLGVYQCVARSQDEWVTQVASLSLKGDVLLAKDDHNKNNISPPESSGTNSHGDMRGNRIKKNVISNDTNRSSSSSPILPNLPILSKSAQSHLEDVAPPDVYVIDDNLAVLLQWQKEDSANGVVRHYRVQYKSQKAETKHWSTIQTLENEIQERYFYVTSSHLQAQFTYVFRISVVMLSGVSINSQWSRQVSFIHIYPVQPVIQRLQSFNASHIRVQWQYSSLARFPVTMYKILVRRTLQDGSQVIYSKYWLFRVSNPESTETYVGPLAPGYRYQVVVYGIKESLPRKITKFSAETTYEIPSRGTSPISAVWPIKNNSESNTRLMFVILGSLAGLMVLVIVVLVLMCYCRERKSVVMHRLNRYKDPAKLIHSSEQAKAIQSSFLLASISAAANANKIQSQQDSTGGGGGGGGGGEHASLLSTGPDNVYYQQKRQPPSGGSGHDMSDGEATSVQEQSMMHTDHNGVTHHMHPSTGLLTPQPPAITYYKASPGPASLPAGSLMRQNHHQQQQQQFSPQRYSPGYQYAPQILYTNAGLVYSPASYLGTMYPGQQQQVVMAAQLQQQQMAGTQRPDLCDMRSQDGGESVYSYFSQTSNNNNAQRQCGIQGTVETGSQTMNSTGSAGHRHHRRKRRKTNNSGTGVSETGELCGTQPKGPMRNMYSGGQIQHHGQREVMYDTPPASHHDPRMINVPPGMVLMQPGMVNGEQCWGQVNNTLTRRGTPTLFVEPPRIRDYSEYGIPHNQMMVGQPQQLAHLSQQNLHLHNQNLSGGYRDAQA